jgi:hypothetical protein
MTSILTALSVRLLRWWRRSTRTGGGDEDRKRSRHGAGRPKGRNSAAAAETTPGVVSPTFADYAVDLKTAAAAFLGRREIRISKPGLKMASFCGLRRRPRWKARLSRPAGISTVEMPEARSISATDIFETTDLKNAGGNLAIAPTVNTQRVSGHARGRRKMMS